MKDRRLKLKKTYWKDVFREIFQSKARFLSIFVIILIGVAFFAGLTASGPVMEETANQYFDDYQLVDLKVQSTLGITDEDYQVFSDYADDHGGELEKSYNVDVVLEGSELTTRMFGYHPEQQLNQYEVVAGRLPESPGEIALDAKEDYQNFYAIGDQVRILEESDENYEDYFTQTAFEVVGFVQSPEFIETNQRGNSQVGSGILEGFGVISEEDLDLPYYTAVQMRFNATEGMDVYSDEYSAYISQRSDEVEEIADERAQLRYQDIQEEGLQEIQEGEAELEQARQELQEAQAELEQFRAQLEASPTGAPGIAVQEDYQERAQDFAEEQDQAMVELDQAEAELDQARNDLQAMDEPNYFVLDHQAFPGLTEFGDNAERIQAIASVFPVFFLLLAVLISLTTMTRMVDENRKEIGTMKALGYNNRAIGMKFQTYALIATITGSLLGLAIGYWLFPNVIMNAYGSVYHINDANTRFFFWISVVSVLAAMASTGLATYFATRNLLKSNAANLLRPKSPKVGKRILLERITPIWQRMTFAQKVSARNLFRYKKRMFMTIFGVAGGMALLLTGFGLSDSISDIPDKQYGQIFNYDMQLIETEDNQQARNQLEEELAESDMVSNQMPLYQENLIAPNETNQSVNLIVPHSQEEMANFILLRDAEDEDFRHSLTGQGAIITEKLADTLNIEPGDQIVLENLEQESIELPVEGVVEHYVGHYVYLSPEAYQHFFDQEPTANARFIQYSNGVDEGQESELENQLSEHDAVLTVILQSNIVEAFQNSLDSLTTITIVLIISAGALSFVVLYNLTNINVSERIRELSTIKVLGYFDREVTAYVYRENMILTVLGILAGIVFGIIMHRFVLSTAEMDNLMFVRSIDLSSYIYSALLILLFSTIVMIVMHFKLKNVDMVEALKTKD